MSKPKTETAELQARIGRLEAELTQTQTALAQEQAQRLLAQAQVTRLQRAVDGAAFWQEHGYRVEHAAIQQVESVPSHETGLIQLSMYQQQEGCLGGRMLPGNRLQTFWQAVPPPISWLLIDIQEVLLPEGMRYVYLVPSQAAALGLTGHAVPSDVDAA